MIQLSGVDSLRAEDITKLMNIVTPELEKRKQLYLRYKRKSKNSDLIYKVSGDKKTTITFEKYIVDIASGYIGGGAPQYVVRENNDETKVKLIQKMLNKTISSDTYKQEMEVLIDYISNFNDDTAEHYQLVKDYFMVGACYERVYENIDNEKVYVRLDPLQTIGLFDYSSPNNLIGLFRTWSEKDINDTEVQIVELIDKYQVRKFQAPITNTSKVAGQQYGTWTEILNIDSDGQIAMNYHNWGDVPGFALEQEEGMSLFENVVDVIDAYEQLIQNTRNTFQYNDEAKLKVTGFMPENAMTIEQKVVQKDENGNEVETTVYVINPARVKEDEFILKQPVFYTPDGDGDIAWVEKNINDTAIQNTLKTYIDLIMMNTGVPNITDLGFTKADNNSALQNKYFALEQMTIGLVEGLKKAYLRRWELIFNRINMTSAGNYDFRDISVVINKNLPQNNKDVVDTWLSMRGLISDSTIIDNLPYDLDSISEQEKVEQQEEKQMMRGFQETMMYASMGQQNNFTNKEE